MRTPKIRVPGARVGLVVAAGALLAMSGCASPSGSDGARSSPSGSPGGVSSPATVDGQPVPAAPTVPVPAHPIPGTVDSASGFAHILGQPGELGNFAGVRWTCGSQRQRLADGQSGYHCVASGDVDGQTGIFLFEVGADDADRVTSVYLAGMGSVPAVDGGSVDEEKYLGMMVGLVGNYDPAMNEQVSDEPVDPPSGSGQLRCTRTDVPLQGVRIGPVLMQWGACSGDRAPWYTLRITAR